MIRRVAEGVDPYAKFDVVGAIHESPAVSEDWVRGRLHGRLDVQFTTTNLPPNNLK
jgi:hypothetical protein